MNVYLHRLATYVPPNSATQEELAVQFATWASDPALARITSHIFRKTGIHRRHSVVPDFTDPSRAELFQPDQTGRLREASTQARNRVYARHAGPIGVRLAGELLQPGSGFAPADVTHVITVSCTGFINPGPDWAIVTELGLPSTVERYHLGFMGCYAALPALRMARAFCQARPDAVVLVVCLELCSLHMQLEMTNDAVLGNALFSDGAAAALVSARPPSDREPALRLDGFMAAMAPEGQAAMAWEIGDRGFNLVLSSYVPDVISANLGRIVGDLMARGASPDTGPMAVGDVGWWAIHPGGRSILDKAESSLQLRPEQVEASRTVLRDFGNMSSATILFVLQRLLQTVGQQPETVAALAFGPGLTVECGLLQIQPARVPKASSVPELPAAPARTAAEPAELAR